jgi:hypothetical protein
MKETVKTCNNLSKFTNDFILNCEDSFKKLLKVMEKDGRLSNKYQKYEFFEIFFFTVFMNFTPFRLVMEGEKKEKEVIYAADFDHKMIIIIDMYHSLLKKYSAVIQLLNAEHYESSIIILRSLYEGLVITEYLLKNSTKDNINSFIYLSAKRYWEAFNVKGSGLYQMSKKLMDMNKPLLEKKEYDRNDSKYGWTGITTDKQKIKFEDILKNVYSNYSNEKLVNVLKFFKVMYRVASEAIHSNCINTLKNPKTLEFFISYSLDNFILEELRYIGSEIIENKIEKNITDKIYEISYNKYIIS